MVSIMNSGDASSFTSAYEIQLDHKVKLDGRGHGTVLKLISSTIGTILIFVRANRLSTRGQIDISAMYTFLVTNMKVPVFHMCTHDRRHSNTLILSTNVDHKSLETEFSIAIF